MVLLSQILKCFTLFCIISSLSSAQPKIKLIEENHFSFGDIYEGYHPSKEIHITNIGTTPLLIHDVSSPCECSKFDLSRSILLPSDTTTLKLTFISDGRSGKSERNVSIISNDSLYPVLSISFSVNVLSILLIDPEALNIIQQKDGSKPKPNQIVIKNSDSVAIKIFRISDPKNIIQTDFKEKILQPGESSKVQFTTNPVGKIMRNGILEICTGSDKQPMLSVPYTIRVIKNKDF